jgi:hypothetical protein
MYESRDEAAVCLYVEPDTPFEAVRLFHEGVRDRLSVDMDKSSQNYVCFRRVNT